MLKENELDRVGRVYRIYGELEVKSYNYEKLLETIFALEEMVAEIIEMAPNYFEVVETAESAKDIHDKVKPTLKRIGLMVYELNKAYSNFSGSSLQRYINENKK